MLCIIDMWLSDGGHGDWGQTMEIGSLADIISAIAAIAAAAVSVFALRTAQQANQISEQVRAEARAGAVQAWWATRPDPATGKDQWGVIINNDNNPSTTFYSLVITCTGNDKCTEPIKINVLPPGTFFVRSDETWGFPEPITNAAECNPILRSQKHTILSAQFIDALGHEYNWIPQLKVAPKNPYSS